MRSRGQQTEEDIQGRLKIAEDEIQQADLKGSYDKIFINDDLDKTYDTLEDYIFNHVESAQDSEGEAPKQNGEISNAMETDGVAPE